MSLLGLILVIILILFLLGQVKRQSTYAQNRQVAGTIVLVILAALALTYVTGWFWPLLPG